MVTVSESESAQITNTPVQGTVSRELSVMEVGAPWMVPGLNGGECSLPCGGIRKRQRACNDLDRGPGSKTCTGYLEETQQCSEANCEGNNESSTPPPPTLTQPSPKQYEPN